jgi:signal transduction histidine kinase
MDKARELGLLRHDQQASVHQLLREYELLAELLESFVIEETARLGLQPSPEECFVVLRRLTRAVRNLMRTTVDTFISEYTTTIEERTERIRTFNQMASHELRNPIGTLLFAAAALDNPAIRSDTPRYDAIVGTIRSNAERLGGLLAALQRLARIGDSMDVPSQQHVEVSGLAMEVKRQLADSAASRGVDVRVAAGLPTLHVDPARLELILVNLVSNGIKYSDPAKPSPYVDIAAVVGPDNTCVITVRDNGIGIAEGDRGAIFDRFFRGHPHLDDSLGVTGSGLGLAIASECVRSLGGSIACESAVGEGTTFLVTLPCPSEPPPHHAV